MPIFARFLTFYSVQYDESYVFKMCVIRSIYSSANLAGLWAIIWYSSMLKWVFQCDATWQNWRCPWGKISLSEAAGSVTRSWSRIGGRWDWLFAPCKSFPYFSLSPVSSLVITLGTGIWAIGDLFRNCQWPCSLARSSGCSLCCGGHLACRSRTDVYHSSLILTSSSPCAVCWSTFPLYMMLQAASVRWG